MEIIYWVFLINKKVIIIRYKNIRIYMYISNLKVEGFCCFDKIFNFELVGGLIVIVGENGVGKMVIISFIR